MPRRTGIRKPLKLGALEIGSITMSTGRSPETAIGARHFLFGVARMDMRSRFLREVNFLN